MLKHDILQNLLDGNKIVRNGWLDPNNPFKYIEYDSNYNMILVHKDGSFEPHFNTFAIIDEWDVYTEPEWFDEIPPQGVICYVDNNVIDIILSFNKDTRKFSSRYKQYSFANPVINAEIELLFFR